MKINIIGRAPDWKAAPLEGICWGFNNHILERPYTAIFDMADVRGVITGDVNEKWTAPPNSRIDKLPESVKVCRQMGVPVYTLAAIEGTTCIAYPFKEVCEHFKTDYFASGITYAMALAMYQGATQIDIWGVSLSVSDEYAYQKPCMEYWIGRAQGMGIKVTIHGMTRLLMNKNNISYGYNIKQNEGS